MGKGQQEFKQTVHKLATQIMDVEKKENRFEKALEILEHDFKNIEEETEETQKVVENVDNTLHKHNL